MVAGLEGGDDDNNEVLAVPSPDNQRLTGELHFSNLKAKPEESNNPKPEESNNPSPEKVNSVKAPSQTGN